VFAYHRRRPSHRGVPRRAVRGQFARPSDRTWSSSSRPTWKRNGSGTWLCSYRQGSYSGRALKLVVTVMRCASRSSSPFETSSNFGLEDFMGSERDSAVVTRSASSWVNSLNLLARGVAQLPIQVQVSANFEVPLVVCLLLPSPRF